MFVCSCLSPIKLKLNVSQTRILYVCRNKSVALIQTSSYCRFYVVHRKFLSDKLSPCFDRLHRGERKTVEMNSKTEVKESNWCLYLSSVLLGTACIVPLISACLETWNTGLVYNEFLVEKYASHYELIGLQLLFAFVHSGLAALRPRLGKMLGERLYRVVFASFSLPVAIILIGFFISHRYDGAILWHVQNIPGIHQTVWITTLLSFYLLYPATFNLLEVAGVRKPELRLFSDGIIRITRHPQLWGQILWCMSHTLWMGSTFCVVTSLCLISYHFFGAWHGDHRLKQKYGNEWKLLAEKSSIIPFAAVLRGDQRIVLSEMLNPAYIGVTVFVLLLYASHPWMIQQFSSQ